MNHDTRQNETRAVVEVNPICCENAKEHLILFLASFKKKVSGILQKYVKFTKIINLEAGKNEKDKIRRGYNIHPGIGLIEKYRL